MIAVTLEWIAQQLNGRLEGSDIEVNNVSTDTRSLQPGDLFIALTGPNFNGHHFVPQAEAGGAAALVCSQSVKTNLPVIYVQDTRQALGHLGAAVKQQVQPKTIAITGSSGKTTVKEMTAAILSRRGSVLATQGNFNNDIGVPLTLLRLEESHEYAVMELGANHLGEIAYTTSLVKPDVATIVNAAAAHLEGFGSLLGVARAKGEIFKGLGDKGLAILNADSQFYNFWQGKIYGPRIQSFSEQSGDYCASDVILGLDGCAQFMMHTPQGDADILLPVPGLHNVSNALCAAALAMGVGASLEDVRMGLQHMTLSKGRLNVKQLTNQVRIIDDSYNANVASVKAAIDLLSSYAGKRVLVLGDMAELGERARFYHEEVGEYARDNNIDLLFSLGVLSQNASDTMDERGEHFEQVAALVERLGERLGNEQQDITILVKGSRSAAMERVVEALEASPLGKLQRLRERMAC
ncbi:UDP-N-acetylmuramoyl-tripeptide--D-alanyl-D-alanine ligase [Saliniradius amylolyticus]|uniref:UDP-N-acetylmuramoyl-tripeptide--D-alanyl-D-alanine ligase n=1 Tax=Saliniradius amylolyticus TaxID=2183582 RepID=A0A2S2E5J6_9ALTE|nr:UDP-N-acetylmuramoyl-tripeptide--D-alanyl-D-alanine ligase [Saliniradius amylolyticus]AWL12926.1 UDP-N-acetylmuramoyl-tripeptide--D-alanyl-D-alanine ligase [Saliniradius amylolyticus]